MKCQIVLIPPASSSGLLCPSGPPKLPLILPAHLHTIPRALPSLPEAPGALANQQVVADSAVLRPVVRFPGAPPTDHAVRPLVRVLLVIIVALVACVHLLAAAEPEPTITLRVVSASAALGELGAGSQAQGLLLAARSAGRWKPVERGDAEELELRDGECEFVVALAADISCCLPAN